MSLTQYQPRQKRWFTGKVGEIIKREATVKTPLRVKPLLDAPNDKIQIMSDQHALALYLQHKDYKINVEKAS